MKHWMHAILLSAFVAAPWMKGQEFKVGSQVTDFSLTHLDGSPTQFSALKGNTTVVMFISVQCPVSNSYNDRMNALYQTMLRKA
jgi:cytochrome oxidase Cu insertion factor (SCO1/SenC/PrrC family)